MRVTLRYFASLREALGSVEVVDIAAGTTLADLRLQLIASSPRHAQALRLDRALRCAVDRVLAPDDRVALVAEASEVAFFPPVTGG